MRLGGLLRGTGAAIAIGLIGLPAAPAIAQSEEPVTAEQVIEAAREVYSVSEPEPEPCPEATGTEIVVCRTLEDPEQFRVSSPTERAYDNDEMPPDPIPNAPYVLGLPECGVEVTCHGIGATPPPIYIIDLKAIPEPLTPEEARYVYRAEDRPSPAAASPAGAR